LEPAKVEQIAVRHFQDWAQLCLRILAFTINKTYNKNLQETSLFRRRVTNGRKSFKASTPHLVNYLSLKVNRINKTVARGTTEVHRSSLN
jgi:hypothetical protein